VTYKPAGTNTAFSNEIFMVASHQEEEDFIMLLASDADELEAAISERKDVSEADKKRAESEAEHFADTKNKKYKLDTEKQIRAAWSYIHMPKNASKYSSDEVAAIKRKIVAAWKSKINKEGPPSEVEATVKSQAESEGQCDMDKEEKKDKVEEERLENASDVPEKDKEQEEARKKADAEKKDQGVKAFEETIASLNKALEDKKAELEAVAAELKAAKELASTLEAKLKNQILAGAFGEDELKGLEAKVGSWSLEQVEVLASVNKPAGKKGSGPVGLEVTGKTGGKEPLTITLKGAK